MHSPQRGICEGQSAEQTRERHSCARLCIRTVQKGLFQEPRRMPYPFATQRIRHRVGFCRNERFDQLRQRVKAGAGSKSGRQVIGQFRIDERERGSMDGLRKLTFT